MADPNNNELIGFIGSSIESLRDEMATKIDVRRLEDKIETSTIAIRGDIEQVHLRFDTMEHRFASRFEQMETELSRLRSAVYVLGKDRPDVLRLLGHNGG